MDYEISDNRVMPSELALSTPRRVKLNLDGDGKFAALMVVLFFVGGLTFLGWLAYYDIRQFEHRAALRVNAREVLGEVKGFSWSRYFPTSVDYEFSVSGVSYSGSALETATPGPSTRFEQGDKILIRYLPENPAVNHPDAWEWSIVIGWWSLLFVVFQTSIGCVVLVVSLRERKLLQVGHAVAATVTACTPKGSSFVLEYEFNVQGELIKGTNSGRTDYAPGARVWILYLTHKPKRNLLYPPFTYSIV